MFLRQIQRVYRDVLVQHYALDQQLVDALLSLVSRNWVYVDIENGGGGKSHVNAKRQKRKRPRQTIQNTTEYAPRLDMTSCRHLSARGVQCAQRPSHIVYCEHHFNVRKRKAKAKATTVSSKTPKKVACMRTTPLASPVRQSAQRALNNTVALEALLDVYEQASSVMARERAVVRIRKGLLRRDEASKYICDLIERRLQGERYCH
jgi:hypothetical protein